MTKLQRAPTAALLLWLAIAVNGCGVQPRIESPNIGNPKRFSVAEVHTECWRLGCAEPNIVVAHYFSVLARQAGAACIVHIATRHGDAPWQYWDEYVHPLHDLLQKSQLKLYGFVQAGPNTAWPDQRTDLRLQQVKTLYLRHGVAGDRVLKHAVTDASTVTPPYREPLCRGVPILELTAGARIVSHRASSVMEPHEAKQLASRIVLVVLSEPGSR